ncbi:hypothetical protein PFICI_07391 [Pestalotiopsis fici W106-1]|uniref:ZW10 C-terminal helical domain-containing protein n=1 Tax=Pestalotiopsis fici (strain W106-1 / CGMCC3.15140) TaxID=1229662 RepID=W3X395_PESFW|nr:uncharacterized protein PFICI_07391 [Pestalotiopsis fici W106-1]ETS79862.1 hypothetical protein PFICI_07391 [Pestalotiopsis fici W106-1]
MASSDGASVGRTLVEFALQGSFPEEDISSRHVGAQDFGSALESLAVAKSELESEIHTINEETSADVQSWVTNAKAVEDDISRSRTLANEIIRRAEAPEVSGQTIREAEDKVQFLQRETIYNRQVYEALTSIQRVNQLLDQVESMRNERRVLESLHLLEKSWSAIDEIPASKSCRVMRILNMRAFELKSAVHDVFNHVWNSLVQVNVEKGQITIQQTQQGEPMNLDEALVGLKAYKEVNQRMALLWHGLDDAIVGPRTNLKNSTLPAIEIHDSSLLLKGQADRSIAALFSDLEQIMGYLSHRLPDELVQALSNVMMPDLVPRIKSVWLASVVPASLKEIDEFQAVLGTVRAFCVSLGKLNYTGYEELQDWIDSAPRVWLTKRRETALDTVRAKLADGLGDPKEVERVETQTVSRVEGAKLAANGAPAATDDDDWGAAWDDGTDNQEKDSTEIPPTNAGQDGNDEDEGADAWGWGDDDATEEQSTTAPAPTSSVPQPPTDDDGDDWGAWGDDTAGQAPVQPASQQPNSQPQTREMTLRETYKISAMPEPVLALIAAILEDGAFLVCSEGNPVAAAAAGLYGLPTFVLAMFRAVSPYYYALDASGGGNMFLYNDATYLSERLAEATATWKAREDLSARAINMLRLDNDIKMLKSFAARAYSTEMTTQRTIVRDLLGGVQNVLQQDGDASDLIMQVEAATSRIRSVAAIWSDILSNSAWCQAVGSLVDSLAGKIIADVLDLSAIGQDEAFNIANLIAKITELDDLFLPPGSSNSGVPTTSQYAENWLRLKFLSEFLQSNLNEVKYLWMESDLSLYFTVDEVIDLIGLSFADSPRTREITREITSNPQPRS